jgi:hypothetical protein
LHWLIAFCGEACKWFAKPAAAVTSNKKNDFQTVSPTWEEGCQHFCSGSVLTLL